MSGQLETILITGGAGFIGSNLCIHFIQKGYRVVCFDNLITGKLKNIESVFNHSNFKFINGDIRNISDCELALEGIDLVCHQAALGSVPRSVENPILTNEINCHGFLNMITAAKNKKVKRFVYASSSSVYGDSQKSPKIENELGKPLSPYAVSKLTNELYGKVFFDLYGLQTIGLRYFNVFGKHQDPNGAYAAAIPKFIDKIVNHQSPEVFGDGLQTRDFTYIKNVIQINEKALFTNNVKAFGKAYNVAFGESYSLLQVIDSIKNSFKKIGLDRSEVNIVFKDKRSGDIQNSLADISAARNDLGYQPEYDFEKGMKEYISEM